MSKLKTTPLSEAISLVIDNRGKTPKKLGGHWSCSGYRAFSAKNIKSTGVVDEDSIRYIDEQLYKKWMKDEIQRGDLLLTSEAPSGQVIVWDSDEKIVLSQRLYGLRTAKHIDNFYLKYYLQSDIGQKEITRNNSGSTVGGISAKAFSNILIRHPDLFEQRKIGSFLKNIDQKIELNNRINAELEAMAKTLYDYWFAQFDFPDGNGKPYKTAGGKMVYNSTLKRKIPEGWEVAQLGRNISFTRGISYKSSEIGDNGVPFINLNSFYLNGNFKYDGIKYYSGAYKDEQQLDEGDLVIAITDVTRNADIIGKAFIVQDVFSDRPLISCDVATVKSDTFSVFYLEQLFNSDIYHSYIKHFASGTLVLHLNLDGMMWFDTFIPPKELLSKFEAFCLPLQKRKQEILKENQQLEQLRDWLLPMLMNGQVRVATTDLEDDQGLQEELCQHGRGE